MTWLDRARLGNDLQQMHYLETIFSRYVWK